MKMPTLLNNTFFTHQLYNARRRGEKYSDHLK